MALSEKYLSKMHDLHAANDTKRSALAASLGHSPSPPLPATTTGGTTNTAAPVASAAPTATPASNGAAGGGAGAFVLPKPVTHARGGSAASILAANLHKLDIATAAVITPPVTSGAASATANGDSKVDHKSSRPATEPVPHSHVAHAAAHKIPVAAHSKAIVTDGAPRNSGSKPSPQALARYGSRKQFRLEDVYDLKDKCELGSGASATVKLCVHKQTKAECAVKIIRKGQTNFDDKQFQEEISIMFDLKHSNIIELKDIFETSDALYLVLELASGGELFDRLILEKRIPERTASQLARRMFDAVAYLHSMGVIHRDLKPENILFSDHSKTAELKISDFGFSVKLFTKPNLSRAKSALGTQGYAAPEVFSGHPYDEKCDVWSLGVITYIMLCGVTPFTTIEADDYNENTPFWVYANQMEKVITKPVEFPQLFWKDISPDAKQFVGMCLELDPKKRPRSYQLLHHPWLQDSAGQFTLKVSHAVPAFKNYAQNAGTWTG